MGLGVVQGQSGGRMSTWAQMPMCYHIIRKGVQVSWCPFSVGPCGLQGRGSGGVQTQVRMSQLSSRKTEGKAFSLGWSQASAPPQRNVASMADMSSHSTPEWGFSLEPPRSAHIRFHNQDCSSSGGIGSLPLLPSTFQDCPAAHLSASLTLSTPRPKARERNCLPVPRWAATQTLLPIHHTLKRAWGLSLPSCAHSRTAGGPLSLDPPGRTCLFSHTPHSRLRASGPSAPARSDFWTVPVLGQCCLNIYYVLGPGVGAEDTAVLKTKSFLIDSFLSSRSSFSTL